MATERLRVNEIYRSIQGESTWVGCSCIFVRLTGCHLRCVYCDTEYAFREGSWMTRSEVIAAVEQAGPAAIVEITGGEPLLQQSVHGLISELCDRGRTVLIETSGSCDLAGCDPRAIRILDLKTPGSGEVDRTVWSNLDLLQDHDEVKFVIMDRADYEWARSIVERHPELHRCRAILFSPVFEQPRGREITGCPGLDPAALADWILQDGLSVRMQLQLHKAVWDPLARGV